MRKSDSPYLQNDQRLADVLAAIQAMGVYKFYKMTFAGWSDRITGSKANAAHWKQVFKDHPEFFRLDSAEEMASLVWRRQHQKLFNVDTEERITKDAFRALSASERERISRTPLTSSELSTLVDAAIQLHARALERKQDLRWWIPVLAVVVGAILGAVL